MFNNQFLNLYYKKDLKTIDINKKTMLIKVRQAIKRQSATLIKAQKTQKTNVDQFSFKTMTSFCERLASTIKASKSTLKILVDKNVFFDLALFFVSRDSKLLKRYAKKLKTIKANLIVRRISFSKNESIRKKIVSRFTNVLATSC